MALIKSQEGTGAGAVSFPSTGIIPSFKLLEVTNDDANNTGSLVVAGQTLTIKPGETRWIGAEDSVATLTITGDYRIAAYEEASDVPAMALLARTVTAGIAANAVGTTQIATGAVDTDELAAGAIAASAPGRLIVATDFVDEATWLDKFAAGSMTSAVLTDVIADDQITAAVAADIIEDGAIAAPLLGSLLVADMVADGELANVINVSVQIVDAAGNAVAAATRVWVEVVGELAAAYTLDNVGVGTQLGSNAAAPGLAMVTDAFGIVTFDVTDVAGASGVAVLLTAATMDDHTAGAVARMPHVNSLIVTFD
jgi:hypothetical protein